jgi:FkbM family methyltransferase
MLPSICENVLMLYARRFPIRRGKLRVINSLWRAAVAGQCTHRVANLKYGKFRMSCDLSEMLQRQFYFFGTYFVEEGILRSWETVARGAKIVLDVGANAGIYSLAALAVRPEATVHAFEPTPEIAARLRETATLNGLDHLHVHEKAVFSRNGKAALKRWRGEFGENAGMNFIVTDLRDSGAERVNTVSLDQFCQDQAIDHVELLKLDIQGQEHSALAGAAHLIRAGRVGTIFLELNWAPNPGVPCPATESIRILDHAGYRFSKSGKSLEWKKAGDWLRTLNDVIAHRELP